MGKEFHALALLSQPINALTPLPSFVSQQVFSKDTEGTEYSKR